MSPEGVCQDTHEALQEPFWEVSWQLTEKRPDNQKELNGLILSLGMPKQLTRKTSTTKILWSN